MTKTLRDDVVLTIRTALEAADDLIARREAEVARHERCRCGSRDMHKKTANGREYTTGKCKECYSAWNAERLRKYRQRTRTPFTDSQTRRVVVRACHGRVTWYHEFDERTVQYRQLKRMNTPRPSGIR
mgnify:CR=1 FL=1